MAKTNTKHDTSRSADQNLLKLKKEDFIRTLANELTDAAWDMISRIRGRAIPETQAGREKLLNSLIHKVSNPNPSTRHGTNRSAAQELQKLACELYSLVTGVPVGSSQDDAAEIKPRQSGQPGIDVVLSPRIRQEMISIGFPDCCECKSVKDWDLQRAIKQAKANTPKGSRWILVMKRRAILNKDRIDPVVVIDLGVFMNMVKSVMEAMEARWPEGWR